MLAAIYWMVRKMDDSHTRFLPPWQTLEPRFGVQVKPFGDTVRVYKIKGKGAAQKAGLSVGDTVLAIDGVVADRKQYWETQFYYRFIRSRALIIDVRGNPGGEIDDLQRFVGYLEKTETELFTEIRRGKTQKITAKPRQPSFSDVPIAVLVDSESASASEILARHLQLSSRAVIIGDKTAGEVAGARFFEQHIGAEPTVFYGAQTTVGHITFPDGKDEPATTNGHPSLGFVQVNVE